MYLMKVKVVWDKMATVGQVDMCELVLMALHRLTYKLQELCYDYNCWSRMESIAALLSSYTLPNWWMWASRSFSLFSENVVYLTCGGFAMAAIKGMIKKGAKGCCMPPPWNVPLVPTNSVCRCKTQKDLGSTRGVNSRWENRFAQTGEDDWWR